MQIKRAEVEVAGMFVVGCILRSCSGAEACPEVIRTDLAAGTCLGAAFLEAFRTSVVAAAGTYALAATASVCKISALPSKVESLPRLDSPCLDSSDPAALLLAAAGTGRRAGAGTSWAAAGMAASSSADGPSSGAGPSGHPSSLASAAQGASLRHSHP